MRNNDHHGGIGFIGLLTILFIGLKLTGHITWSWVWVLSPLWIGLVSCLVLSMLILGAVFMSFVIASIIERRK
jgi:hypothetical protein